MAIETDLSAIYIRLVPATHGGCADKAEATAEDFECEATRAGLSASEVNWLIDLASRSLLPIPLGEFEADHALGRSLNEERSAYPQFALEHLFAELLSAGEADGKH